MLQILADSSILRYPTSVPQQCLEPSPVCVHGQPFQRRFQEIAILPKVSEVEPSFRKS